MSWHDLLFAHWSVAEDSLRPHIPRHLQLDTYQGQVWLGVVPFGMRNTRPRWLPPIPGVSSFPELNVRTYVVADDKPGVWFFSLDAASRLAVRGARLGFHLPYYDARMTLQIDNDGWVCYRSLRIHRDAPPAEFAARYRPTGPVYTATPGGLESWLTDRYCLYSANQRGQVFRGQIHHAPWPLQSAEAEWEKNTMSEQLGFTLPQTAPLLHFARELHVVGWLPERLT